MNSKIEIPIPGVLLTPVKRAHEFRDIVYGKWRLDNAIVYRTISKGFCVVYDKSVSANYLHKIGVRYFGFKSSHYH